jgi:hypothetical protein
MIPWPATQAWAEPPEVRSETLMQARTDVAGDLFVGGVQTLGGTASLGSARLEGYGDLGFRSGFDQAFDGELYVLSADGTSGPVAWTIGRQPLLLPTWNRRLDGGSAHITLSRSWSMDAALGFASQAWLPGAYTAVPVARLAATGTSKTVRATVGGWVELVEVPVGHGDLTVRWTPDAGDLAPVVNGTAAVGLRDGQSALERGRAELSLRPMSGLRALAWVEHRESLPGTQIAADILNTFAPSGADSVGLGAGWSTRNRHRLWASGSLQRWATGPDPAEGETRTGVVGELRWEPRCGEGRWCVSPGWQGLSGPGGILDRVGTSVGLPLPPAFDVTVNGSWVPWREPHLTWRSALVAGAVAEVRPTKTVGVEAGCDVMLGTPTPFTRAWLALHLRTGRTP